MFRKSCLLNICTCCSNSISYYLARRHSVSCTIIDPIGIAPAASGKGGERGILDNLILILLKVCKECNNSLKQVGDQSRYYCDSSPTICSMSGKIHNI